MDRTSQPITGRAALAHVRETFARDGLLLPIVPDVLVDTLAVRGQWHWSTWSESYVPYQSGAFHLAALSDVALRRKYGFPSSDYLLVGHGGHGVNSYTLGYFLVHGPLALFVEVGWGGAYMNPETATATWNETARLVSSIVESAGALSSRTIVMANGFGESWWSPSGDEDRRPRGKEHPSGLEVLEGVLGHVRASRR